MSGRQAKKFRKELRRQAGRSSGALNVRVHARPGGIVQIDFDAAVASFSLPAEEARRLAETLIGHANKAAPVLELPAPSVAEVAL